MKHQSRTFPSLDLFVWLGVALTLSGCHSDERTDDPPRFEVEVTGEKRQWTARYPGPDGVFQTSDDRLTPGEITVPAGVPVSLHLRSNDSLYLFSLPHLGLREIAAPDLEFQLRFVAKTEGDFELIGGQLCGRPNSNHGTFRVRALTKFQFPPGALHTGDPPESSRHTQDLP